MTNDNRVPAGSPEGGQFAAGTNPEPDASVDLLTPADDEFSVTTFDVRDPHVIVRHDGSHDLAAVVNIEPDELDRALASSRGTKISNSGEMTMSVPLHDYATPNEALVDLDERARAVIDERNDVRADFGLHDDMGDDETAIIDIESDRVEAAVRSVGASTQIDDRPAVVAPNITGHPMGQSLDYDGDGESDWIAPSAERDGVIVASEPDMGVSVMSRSRLEREHPQAAKDYYDYLETCVTGQPAAATGRLDSTRAALHRAGVNPNVRDRMTAFTAIQRDEILYANGGEKLHDLHDSASRVTADDLPDGATMNDVRDTVNDPRITTAQRPTTQSVIREATQRGMRRIYGHIDESALPAAGRSDARESYPGIVESESLGVSVMALSAQRNARIPEAYRSDDGLYYGPAARSVVLRTFDQEAQIAGDTRGIEHTIPRSMEEYRRRSDRSKSFFV